LFIRYNLLRTIELSDIAVTPAVISLKYGQLPLLSLV